MFNTKGRERESGDTTGMYSVPYESRTPAAQSTSHRYRPAPSTIDINGGAHTHRRRVSCSASYPEARTRLLEHDVHGALLLQDDSASSFLSRKIYRTGLICNHRCTPNAAAEHGMLGSWRDSCNNPIRVQSRQAPPTRTISFHNLEATAVAGFSNADSPVSGASQETYYFNLKSGSTSRLFPPRKLRPPQVVQVQANKPSASTSIAELCFKLSSVVSRNSSAV
ncbi:hypothetical protein C8R43DRAFT_942682 [Mycena crocata]|nr:hypothetical protein C8R43DRAFT_942682 [Mycena crocata]